MPRPINTKEMKNLHGGYWRYSVLDFYYLHNPYFPPQALISRMQAELPQLINSYPSTQRVITGLLAAWKTKSYFTAENLIVANGSSELIRIINTMITKATLCVPTFNEYLQLPPRKKNLHYLREEEKFGFDVQAFVAALCQSKSDFAVICNPNNPVGNLATRKDVETILRTGVKLILDEAFIDWSGPEYSCEDMIDQYENLIIVKSLTKVAGVAGLRLGYLLTKNKRVREYVLRMLPIWNINSLTERFIELFPEFDADFRRSLTKGKKNRDNLRQKLQEIDYLEPYESFANFIFCKTKISAPRVAEFLFEKHDILIKDSLDQENLKSDNYLRVGVRTPEDNTKLLAGLNDPALRKTRD